MWTMVNTNIIDLENEIINRDSTLNAVSTNIYEKDGVEEKTFFIDAPGVCSKQIEVTVNLLQEETTIKFKRKLPGISFAKSKFLNSSSYHLICFRKGESWIHLKTEAINETIEFTYTFQNTEENKLNNKALNFKEIRWDYENGVITLTIPQIKSEQPIFKMLLPIPISSKRTNENGSL